LVDNVTNVTKCLQRFVQQEQEQLMSMGKAG
jgi:hypothetical protein